jgi:hypothetical protein
MTIQNSEVLDRNGKRVRRDGIVQDGDMVRVPMQMMDAGDPRLIAAAALADAVKRNEQFDARGHRPGYAVPVSDAAAETARDRYHARTVDAWKNPPPVLADAGTSTEKVAIVGPSAGNDALFAARDKAVANRDKRTSEAWKA